MGKCYNSIVVKAPANKVWATIRDFHDLSWAAALDLKLDKKGDKKGDQIGAQRSLNDAFQETLLALDETSRSFSYSIDDGPGPVAKDQIRNYVGTVRVSAITEDDSAFVEWISRYDSANDSAVGELCNPIYQGALKALRDHLA